MEGHIHLSALSFMVVGGMVVIWVFLLHMAALRLSASDNPTYQAWGKAFAAGWG